MTTTTLLPFSSLPLDVAPLARAALSPLGLEVRGLIAPLAEGALVNIGSEGGWGPVDSFTLAVARAGDAFSARLIPWATGAAAAVEAGGSTVEEAISSAFRAWFA